jgi:glycosyltransferase involved in cell wall biosynthesis
VRILCFSRGYQKEKFSGCWWIRLKVPFEQLGKKHYVCLTDGVTEYPLDAFQIVVLNNVIAGVQKMRGDKVTGDTTVEDMVGHFRRIGLKIVYDLDDSQEIHPLLGAVGKLVDDNLPSYFYLLKEADLITCTTEHLKNHLRQFTDKPIAVLPNCINPLDFPKRKQNDKVKIGYAGSYSHIPDFEIVKDAISSLKRKHDIYFELFGFDYPPFKRRKVVPMERYYEELADMGNDIAIAPLLDNEFNHNKSPLKFLENVAVGSMTLCSNRLPYKGDVPDKWLVNDDKWEETLEKYVLDSKLRERTYREQRKWLLENRDIRKEWVRWEKEYRKLLC